MTTKTVCLLSLVPLSSTSPSPSPARPRPRRMPPPAPLPSAKPPSDATLVTELDEMVFAAARGDRQAIGAIALAFTPNLLAEANDVLDNEHDAADVVQDFFLALLEGGVECLSPPRGRALAFLFGVVRAMAQSRLAEASLS